MELLQSQPELSLVRSDNFYRYLGLMAIVNESDKSGEYLKRQIETELAESIDAELSTRGRPELMQVEDDVVYGGGGVNMTASAYLWALEQQERAKTDQRYQWLADIANQELAEYAKIASFARLGQTGDSLLVMSLFPEENYDNVSTKQLVADAGYNPALKRAFLRAYQMTEKGLEVHVQSVDSSNLEVWNQLLDLRGHAKASTTTELLGSHLIFKDTQAETLLADFVDGYDNLLYRTTGFEHFSGRPKGGTPEANTFIWQHMEIVEDTITELKALDNSLSPATLNSLAEQVLYNSKALINYLYDNPGSVTGEGDVREMRQVHGKAAADRGETYYGCSGASVSTTVTSESASVFKNSFSVKHGVEVYDCTTCPVCNHVVSALRDQKTATWACPRRSCAGYNPAISSKYETGNSNNFMKGSAPDKDFSDLLVEFLFGNEDEAEAKKLAKLKQKKIARMKQNKNEVLV